jgi:hypothetical protein
MFIDNTVNDFFLKKVSTDEFNKSFKSFYEEIESTANTFSSSPLPSLFHPIFISEPTFNSLKGQSELISCILQKTVKLFLLETEIQQFFKFPEELLDWIKVDPGYTQPVPISRYDGFWKNDTYRFCEFNTDGTAGMSEIDSLETAFRNTEIGRNIIDKYSLSGFDIKQSVLDTILKSYAEFAGNSKKPNIGIVDFTEAATSFEFKILENFFRQNGYNTEVCDIRKVKFKHDGLWHDNFKIDLVYRRAVTDDIFRNKEDVPEFLEAYCKNAVCVVGPLRSQIVHSKLIFAFLSSSVSDKYFSKREKEIINKHIPWTRRINDQSLSMDEIISNKDNYFLKPHDSYACKGVYCGTDFTADLWSEMLNDLVKNKGGTYIIQKSIDLPKIDFRYNKKGDSNLFNMYLGPYIFDGLIQGFYAKVSESNIITTSNKGMLTPVFIGK